MLTISDICLRTGKKKAAVSMFLTRNGIECKGRRGKYKFYDESAEPLASYIGGVGKTAGAPVVKPAKKPQSADGHFADEPDTAEPTFNNAAKFNRLKSVRTLVRDTSNTPINDLFSKILGVNGKPLAEVGGITPAAVLLNQAYKTLKESEKERNISIQRFREENGEDAPLPVWLSNQQIHKDFAMIAAHLAKEHERARAVEHERIIFDAKQRKAESEAEKVKIENSMRRGELVKREAVKREWGKMCAVIVSQLHPIGIKLATQIAALVGASDTKTRLEVQAVIDSEIYAVCGNVRRELGVVD